jgi:hypothetical protein
MNEPQYTSMGEQPELDPEQLETRYRLTAAGRMHIRMRRALERSAVLLEGVPAASDVRAEIQDILLTE